MYYNYKYNNIFDKTNNFIIEFPNSMTDKYGTYKKSLLNLIFNKYPYLKSDHVGNTTGYKDISWAGPNDGFQFGKKHSLSDINFSSSDYIASLKKENTIPVINIADNWSKAVSFLDSYATKYAINKPSYDLLIGNTPINIFDGYIQVGQEIIPFDANPTYLNSLNKNTQKVIIELIIKIDNNSLF